MLNQKSMLNQKAAIVLLPVFWPNLPPLSLAYLKGFLKGHGVQIDAIDFNHFFFQRASEELQREWRKSCNRELEENIIHTLQASYPQAFQAMVERLLTYDVIGFSCYKSNITATQKVCLLLKDNKPSLRLILGGPEITSSFFRYRDQLGLNSQQPADLLVAGEGEFPLFYALTGGEYPLYPSYTSISMVTFQEQEDLTTSPGPDFSDFDLGSYPRQSTIALLLSRGCIKKCRFCAERLLYKRFRLYSIEHIIAHIRALKGQGINTFIFHDSLINGNLDWLEGLCEAIIRHFGSIRWEAQLAIRGDMSEQLLRKIKASGCYHLFVGLESGCARTLKEMRKGYTPEEAIAFFKRLKEAELSFGVSILVGFPGETQQDFLESLNFILRYKEFIPKIEQVNPFVYYHGIPLPEASDYDYKVCPQSLDRARFFIQRLKEEGLKYTNAFLLNMVEPEWKSQPGGHVMEGHIEEGYVTESPE